MHCTKTIEEQASSQLEAITLIVTVVRQLQRDQREQTKIFFGETFGFLFVKLNWKCHFTLLIDILDYFLSEKKKTITYADFL